MNKALDFILDKNFDDKTPSFVNIFGCDDKKKSQNNNNLFREIKKDNHREILETCEGYNVGSLGIFISLNPLSKNTRKKEFIKKINFVFIDLDHADENDLSGVKTYLDSKDIYASYICQSGSGYHLLVEVDFKTDCEIKVKNFLKYLHSNVSSKVDVSTGDLTRLIRVPESEHNKKAPFMLKTLHLLNATETQIKTNCEQVLALQLNEEKSVSNMNYLVTIKKDDMFFNEILNRRNDWKEYYNYLDNSTMRNNVFIKNLAFFCRYNKNNLSNAVMFIEGWEKSRVKAFEGWIRKCSNENLEVNYYELLKWSKENKLDVFTEFLYEQTKETFLDNYELYYLEEEKTENNCLLYFPDKNYYIQKSIPEVILNIYYDVKEKGLDLVNELNLNKIYDKWETFNFKKQMTLIQDQIRRILEEENRIKLIYNINYAPTDEKFITIENKKHFNIYKKTNLLNLDISDVKDYEFRNIKELIFNICGGDETNYIWFIEWLAWQVQFPTSKLPTAVILQGEQGTGKGVFKTHILDAIFGNNCQEINQTHLESSFNEYLLGKQVIVANEVMHNENRQTLPNILKNLVTDEYITIQRKFRKDLVIRNYTHWIFCTNSDNPIKIEEGDRRYSVFKSKKLKGGGKPAQIFVKQLIENKEHELPHFLQYLKQLEVNEYLVSNPLVTEAKIDIQNLNKDSVIKFLETLSETTIDEAFNTYIPKINFDTVYIDSLSYVSTDLFYLLYQGYCECYGEYGKFNKQTFSKKLISYNISNSAKYVSSIKKSLRLIQLKELKNILDKINPEVLK